jgi:hypothetical protein
MPAIPGVLLKQLYVKGSLRVLDGNTQFEIKNHLANATIQGMSLAIDGQEIDRSLLSVSSEGVESKASEISGTNPFRFAVHTPVVIKVHGLAIAPGQHTLTISPATKEIGVVSFSVSDTVA